MVERKYLFLWAVAGLLWGISSLFTLAFLPSGYDPGFSLRDFLQWTWFLPTTIGVLLTQNTSLGDFESYFFWVATIIGSAVFIGLVLGYLVGFLRNSVEK